MLSSNICRSGARRRRRARRRSRPDRRAGRSRAPAASTPWCRRTRARRRRRCRRAGPRPRGTLRAALGDDVGRRRTRRATACRSACRDIAMTRSAPSRLAASTAHSPTAPSPTTTTVAPGPTPRRDGRVVAGAHDVGQREQPGTATSQAGREWRRASRRPAAPAPAHPGRRRRARARRDRPTTAPCAQEVCTPLRQCTQVPSEMANGAITKSPACSVDTSEPTSSTTPTNSCPMRLRLRRLGDPAVGPEVGAADARGDHPDHGVTGKADLGVGDVLDTDVPGSVDEGGAHSRFLLLVRCWWTGESGRDGPVVGRGRMGGGARTGTTGQHTTPGDRPMAKKSRKKKARKKSKANHGKRPNS